MKNQKINLIAIIILINTVANAQNLPECKFYLNNETSPKKETLCNDLKSLKVQVPIPSTVSQYDKVEIQRIFTDPSDDINAGIYYYDYGTGYGEIEKFPNSRLVWETKEATKNLASKSSIDVWIANRPNKNELTFKYDALYGNYMDVYLDDACIPLEILCNYKEYNDKGKIAVIVGVKGYYKTGERTVTRESGGYLITEKVPVYDNGELLSYGTFTINFNYEVLVGHNGVGTKTNDKTIKADARSNDNGLWIYDKIFNSDGTNIQFAFYSYSDKVEFIDDNRTVTFDKMDIYCLDAKNMFIKSDYYMRILDLPKCQIKNINIVQDPNEIVIGKNTFKHVTYTGNSSSDCEGSLSFRYDLYYCKHYYYDSYRIIIGFIANPQSIDQHLDYYLQQQKYYLDNYYSD